MKQEIVLEKLRNEPIFWSRLGFAYDPPRKNELGKPLVFTEQLERYTKTHRAFREAGVKIHTCLLHSGWMGVDEYDYSLTDRVVEQVFSVGDDIYYIPRIKLNPPIAWLKENPEEVLVYGAPKSREEIARLVGTQKQDIMGFDSPEGYGNAEGFVDDRSNVGGEVAMQSFTSEKWKQDAGKTLASIVRRLEASPYAERILAYHIAYGACGESMLWGRESGKMGDYGIANQRAFFAWGMEQYNSLAALRAAWQQPGLTAENFVLPPFEQRFPQADTLETFFRAHPEDQIAIDYDRFISQKNADAIEYFGKIVKDNTHAKPVGVFYGYYMHVTNSSYTGHLALEQLLRSPYVDFFSAPKSYFRVAPGEPGSEMCPSASINRQKLWIDESDNRTHLCKKSYGYQSVAQNLEETGTVIWRELAKNLQNKSGFWWMDLGGCWYDDANIMQEVKKAVSVNARLRKHPQKAVRDVLFVSDEATLYHVLPSDTIREAFMENQLCRLHTCGVAVDSYRLADLDSLDLSSYKLIFFSNIFSLQEAAWAELQKRIAPDTTLVWNYAGGLLGPEYDTERVKRVTGFRIAQHPGTAYWKPDFVPIEILPDADTLVLKEYADGGIMAAKSTDGKRIDQAYPCLTESDLREICREAGCHLYADLGCTVYTGNGFAAVFSQDAVDSVFDFGTAVTATEIITGETYKNVKQAPINMAKHDVRFFLLE